MLATVGKCYYVKTLIIVSSAFSENTSFETGICHKCFPGNFRDVFRILKNIYDGTFSAKITSSLRCLIIFAKSSMIYV